MLPRLSLERAPPLQQSGDAPQLIQRLTAALVCLGVAAYGWLTAWIAPVSARVHYDPSLQYMLSSLSLFRGGTYAYIDHPGTPVELVGSAILALSYPLVASAPGGFVNFELTHPQDFLSIAQTFIVVASMAAAGFVAWRSVVVRHWSQALAGSAVAALFFALLPGAFGSLGIWSHESFCFPAGTLLSLLVLLAIRRADRPSLRVVVGLGLAAGVLTSIQLYFAAWIVGSAVAVGVAARLSNADWRDAGIRGAGVVAASGLGFVVATLPIRDHYRPLAGWIWLLISHQGNYGGGAPGFSSPDLLASNLGVLVLDAPLLFVASGAAIVLVLLRLWFSRRRPRCQPAVWAAGLGFVAQLLVLLVLVAKHPGVRYLLPIAATVPLLFAAGVDRLDVTRALTRWLMATCGIAVLAGFALSLAASIGSHENAVESVRRQDLTTETVLTNLAGQRNTTRASLRTLWTYATTSPCYALWFADDSADHLFKDDIGHLCPNDANLNVWNATITSSSGENKLADNGDWDALVLPEELARMLPQSRPPGAAYESSIPSLGYGQLLFITRPN